MCIRDRSKTRNKPVFQNTKESVEKDQDTSNEINDVQLDSEYLEKSDHVEPPDGDKSIDSKPDTDEK